MVCGDVYTKKVEAFEEIGASYARAREFLADIGI